MRTYKNKKKIKKNYIRDIMNADNKYEATVLPIKLG